MFKRLRFPLLLLCPLLLGALVGGARWKQNHPTPTQLDLDERALLGKAVTVEIWDEGLRGELPVSEFKTALNDFYLLDGDLRKMTLRSTSSSTRRIHLEVFAEDSPGVPISLASIGVSPFAYYDSFYKSSFGKTQVSRFLHPVTQRRLRELVAKNLPAQ